jgi:hypothetical protein
MGVWYLSMQILLPSLIIFFDIALPAALLIWVWQSRAKSRVYLFSVVVLVAMYLIAVKISIFGFWHVIGVYWPSIFFFALFLAVSQRLRVGLPVPWMPTRWSKEGFLTVVNLFHASAWLLVIVAVFLAKRHDVEPVKLSVPLRDGIFLIIGGGANRSVNQHSRAVKYALDITKLTSFGMRARAPQLFPEDLTKYAVFGTDIIAPCNGEIIGMENSVPNQAPLQPSFSGIGNYVALFCQGHTIRLLHMQQGSVKVTVGETVTTGQLLGQVGNSGTTIEPHLHIDAVVGRQLLNTRNDGGVKSVPIHIDGRFLIKGDTFESQR